MRPRDLPAAMPAVDADTHELARSLREEARTLIAVTADLVRDSRARSGALHARRLRLERSQARAGALSARTAANIERSNELLTLSAKDRFR